jgi:hypothetical protein
MSVALQSDAVMQPFQIKTLAFKKCARCGSLWSTERVTIEPHEKINLDAVVKIAYCPSCAEGFAAEIDRPTYNRTGKKLR